jgi:hypothetical protein
MKKLIIFFVAFYSFFVSHYSLSQSVWSPPQRLTSGFVDRNPSFRTVSNTLNINSILFLQNFEFFTFVRSISSYSQICLGKLTNTGLADSILYLTSGNFIHRNPCIAYAFNRSTRGPINSALVLWETNENSSWDIYGKFYNRQTGWGSQFVIDNSASIIKSSPQSMCIDSNNYAIVYTKGNDIIFKAYNPYTMAVTYDTNLTVNDTAVCFNPHLNIYNSPSPVYYFVTYEKRKPDNKRAIYCRKNTALISWSAPDTIAYAGDNYFNSFSWYYGSMNYPMSVSFTSDRSGLKDIYLTTVSLPTGNGLQEKTLQNTVFNFYNFNSINFPIVTDYSMSYASAVLKRNSDSVKIMFDYNSYSVGQSKDSTTVCDTSKNISVTLGSAFTVGTAIWEWVLYNKDSAGVSQIYGRKKQIMINSVSKIGNSVPDKFSLSQNYPNPFNPSTNIKFQIANNKYVLLKVFDVIGREVQTLVNEKLKPGEYEVTFDGSALPSGVYFYKLTAGEFTQTKKLILLK